MNWDQSTLNLGQQFEELVWICKFSNKNALPQSLLKKTWKCPQEIFALNGATGYALQTGA
jgi:hypothetical protein